MALLIASSKWAETKTRGIFCKKGVVFFWESGYLTYIYCLNNKSVGRA